MQRVRLETANGGHVANAMTLPFQKPPVVLFWGSRVFTHVDGDENSLIWTFRESFAASTVDYSPIPFILDENADAMKYAAWLLLWQDFSVLKHWHHHTMQDNGTVDMNQSIGPFVSFAEAEHSAIVHLGKWKVSHAETWKAKAAGDVRVGGATAADGADVQAGNAGQGGLITTATATPAPGGDHQRPEREAGGTDAGNSPTPTAAGEQQVNTTTGPETP